MANDNSMNQKMSKWLLQSSHVWFFCVVAVAMFCGGLLVFFNLYSVGDLLRDIYSAAEFQAATAEPNCIVLLDVDWSATSAVAEHQLSRLANILHRLNDARLGLYRADLTQRSDLGHEISKFLLAHGIDRDTAKRMLHAGAGTVLWIKNGKLEHHEFQLVDMTDEQVIEQTRTLFVNP